MPDMAAMLEQAQQMQEQVVAAQERLTHLEVEGSAGGGLVKAKVTGMGELINLDIDPEVIDPTEPETLADLVVAAIGDATSRAGDIAAAELGPFAGIEDPGSTDLAALGL